jgi:hypothetical protein
MLAIRAKAVIADGDEAFFPRTIVDRNTELVVLLVQHGYRFAIGAEEWIPSVLEPVFPGFSVESQCPFVIDPYKSG